MTKKVAVLVVNPVNGFGLFQYLESFFENGISYKTFAVSETIQVKTKLRDQYADRRCNRQSKGTCR